MIAKDILREFMSYIMTAEEELHIVSTSYGAVAVNKHGGVVCELHRDHIVKLKKYTPCTK